MKRIFYYNIDYFCNNNCLFCFSVSTGKGKGIVPLEQIKKDVSFWNMNKNDLIVLNGGEPTLHPDFYNIIEYIMNKTESFISIYTNGTIINTKRIPNTERIKIIIPIHGNAEVHDLITQNPGSYQSTLKTLHEMQNKKIFMSIKFIVGWALVNSEFSISKFLEKENILPDEIVIARQNVTPKSIHNKVKKLDTGDYAMFIKNTFHLLKDTHRLLFLDTPICQLPEFKNRFKNIEKPKFFFGDCNNKLIEKKYYKQIKIFSKCVYCTQKEICEIISNSYLTTVYDKKWLIECE